MNKKIMTEEEMNNFIESINRAELFEERCYLIRHTNATGVLTRSKSSYYLI